MTKTNFSILAVMMIFGAFLIVPSAHALIVTSDGFTQSSGHSRYTALSSMNGRICGLELCNLVVPNLKSSTDLSKITFEKTEGKELTNEQRLARTLEGEIAKALLANYKEHKNRDIGMLVKNGTSTELFANPDFINSQTKTGVPRIETEITKFIVVLPEYIAKYAIGYANPDFPVTHKEILGGVGNSTINLVDNIVIQDIVIQDVINNSTMSNDTISNSTMSNDIIP